VISSISFSILNIFRIY